MKADVLRILEKISPFMTEDFLNRLQAVMRFRSLLFYVHTKSIDNEWFLRKRMCSILLIFVI